MNTEKILVTGACGQIGTVLTDALRNEYGTDQVIASDLQENNSGNGPFEILDILDQQKLAGIIDKHKITQIYHLAAILSAKGEKSPRQTWQTNMGGLFNVLEAAKNFTSISKVFFPSSIAVFGRHSPKTETPQNAYPDPGTVYGISKVGGEFWCQYYHQQFQVDVRSIRYPGIIGYQSLPGGGTTDYAVEIFHKAVKDKTYECFIKPGTRLPMLYMPDAIRATLEIMEAPQENLTVRTSYNLAGMSFSPAELASEIQVRIPDFQITYKPDYRNDIAESWCESIDDSLACKDWNWKPEYDISRMTKDMIEKLNSGWPVME